jgi:predicted enzyme related to lactoylglutathione lyase
VKPLLAFLLGFAALSAAAGDLPPLNSPATTDCFPGKFIWADLFTADPAAAKKFYTGLFGWTAVTIERSTTKGLLPYVVLSNGDRPVAGIMMRPPRMKDELHARWVGYVSVPDVSRALTTAIAAGGHVLSRPKELQQRGTQAILSDSSGAMLGVMHSSSGDPGEYLPEPGDWTWAELFAGDSHAATLFYHTVIGYSSVPGTRPDQPNEFILTSGGYSRASVSPVPARANAHPTWLLFIRVANVKEAVAIAVNLGGRVRVPPSNTPTEHWRAIISDPTGGQIGLVELENQAEGKP